MSKTIAMKEALSHGFAMTRKYAKLVALVMAVYLCYSFVSEYLGMQAGESHVAIRDIKDALYEEKDRAEGFFIYLRSAGYIEKWGGRTRKLEILDDPMMLELSSEYERDREIIYEFLEKYTYRLPFPKTVYFVLAILLWIIGTIMSIGLVKISIMLARDQQPAFSELYSNGKYFFPYVLAGIAYGLAVMGGFILLIVPGFIMLIMLGMYTYLIVDKEMRPIESLKASRALTYGVRWQLFLLGVLVSLVNFAGLLCLGIGLLVTLPATVIAFAYVYDQLQQLEDAPAA